ILLLVGPPITAEPTADELQANRRRFEQLKKHPDQLEKVRAESKDFFSLPEERQKQIAELRQQLSREPAAIQARLQSVLERYAEWLGSLDETTRDKIKQTPDKQTRLALIRAVREQQWITEQPKALQEKIAALQGEARKALIAKEKEDERRRRV